MLPIGNMYVTTTLRCALPASPDAYVDPAPWHRGLAPHVARLDPWLAGARPAQLHAYASHIKFC